MSYRDCDPLHPGVVMQIGVDRFSNDPCQAFTSTTLTLISLPHRGQFSPAGSVQCRLVMGTTVGGWCDTPWSAARVGGRVRKLCQHCCTLSARLL
ncbi:hypothetical protein SEA_SAHARA_32 [Gordonia phage Sahara]|uniref:Uncharacterized protein n=2 Tax=Attisvirus TaxID=2169652 RepID=A0AAE8BGX5_9CAUD|nr:hypothetical protein PP498_gp32 [Gordonia phage Sahara]YP_010653895.1 hypothetical protein PP500_gp34 [Gordonia phage Ebert]AZS12820.1 hypothetical protein SEA_SPROUTIE_33 [Gordonia phage Sproutie]AZS12897.1 hypothetical protein SEA_SAVAGE_33 [Gordonia phage Savage]QCW22558.1 hypothetical protein SEA_HALEY23_33 [Gordonia phage Haley23]QGJ96698.1 hypothetical protein SEA_CYNTHIA_33 [Gordonia phage Cynthia]QOC59199.1 hypothetical protein SEA_GEMG_33 [Gordonia phage GemG]QPL13641.1 hypotheti